MESESIRLNLDAETFAKIFNEHLPQTDTYEQAYERAEEQHEKLTGHKRYSNYDSFRIARYQRMKKKNK